MKNLGVLYLVFILNTLAVLEAADAPLPAERIAADRPDFDASVARPLRYHPEGTDFVIIDGKEFFNRPLYGGNTAFRVDAGDLPECVLYLPGRGGNLRVGIRTPKGMKWLHEADKIAARYRPGSMVYEIQDSLLNEGTIHLTLMATYQTEGLIVQAELSGKSEATSLVWAYGGVSGQRGRRDGDIGCEPEPVSKFFQLKPEYCRENVFELAENGFTVRGKSAVIEGIYSGKSEQVLADANHWNSLDKLQDAGKSIEQPVVFGQAPLKDGQPFYLSLRRTDKVKNDLKIQPENLPALFKKTEDTRKSIANHITVSTPDPYLNAAAAAMCVAADAVWDEPSGTIQHGAVAWRSRLLGWRGNYANDALGWHDRSKRHLTYWAKQQETGTIPPAILPADPEANLARNEPSLHTNGTMSKSHYDMNLVYIDSLFRYLLWTGDMEMARQVWPVIERHLAWERRLFRRPFDAGKSPLYEAYAAIWASDDLQYSGGGVTHTTAYNYYHNKMAAAVAKRLGQDASLYEQEAELIDKAIRKELWLQDGWFAEYKDWLGLQRLHPAAGVYTFYHTVDSEVPTSLEAWQMSRFIDTQIARIPIQGPSVPEGNYFTVPSSNWMPYSWSVNNVVMAEAAHTALAYWQAGRSQTAFELFKGCILDSMYLGLCPGNVGMCTFYDKYRGESQRDFADGAGAVSRGLVEGLFGIRPDIMAGQLVIEPGFPEAWEHASIRHPQVAFGFQRSGLTEHYTAETGFTKPVSLQLRVRALKDQIAAITVNGKSTAWKPVKEAVGSPKIEISADASSTYEVVITWKGDEPSSVEAAEVIAQEGGYKADFGSARLLEVADPQKTLAKVKTQDHGFAAQAVGAIGHRMVFARLEQGGMQWWVPVPFEIRLPCEILSCGTQDASHLSFNIRNNMPEPIDETVEINYGILKSTQSIHAKAYQMSPVIRLPAAGLVPGTVPIAITLKNGTSINGQAVNWKIQAAAAVKQKTVDLAGQFNAGVSQIFKNEYRSPRSPFCSLAIPMQGYGSWCNFKETPEIDDDGLRRVVSEHGGVLATPMDIDFQSVGSGQDKNVAFVSLWDNYPNEMTVPLAGKADHLYLLMVGSTNSMQCHIDNAEVIVTYQDDSSETLILRSPENWWPIDQDFYIDDYAFRRPGPIGPRVDLKTGQVRILEIDAFKKKGKKITGGAANVLDLPLDGRKELKSLTVRVLSNEIVVGLMGITLVQY